jgi:hypothetical protein
VIFALSLSCPNRMKYDSLLLWSYFIHLSPFLPQGSRRENGWGLKYTPSASVMNSYGREEYTKNILNKTYSTFCRGRGSFLHMTFSFSFFPSKPKKIKIQNNSFVRDYFVDDKHTSWKNMSGFIDAWRKRFVLPLEYFMTFRWGFCLWSAWNLFLLSF